MLRRLYLTLRYYLDLNYSWHLAWYKAALSESIGSSQKRVASRFYVV